MPSLYVTLRQRIQGKVILSRQDILKAMQTAIENLQMLMNINAQYEMSVISVIIIVKFK